MKFIWVTAWGSPPSPPSSAFAAGFNNSFSFLNEFSKFSDNFGSFKILSICSSDISLFGKYVPSFLILIDMSSNKSLY